jgi:hypothetical protein
MGLLDENAWVSCKTESEFFAYPLLLQTTGQTSFKIFKDKNSLFFGISLKENKPKKDLLKTYDTSKIFQDDTIEIFIQPNNSPKYYQIVFNLNSSLYDAVYDISTGSSDVAWQSDATFAISRPAVLINQWVLEAKLPLAALGLSTDSQSFQLNVCRNRVARIKVLEKNKKTISKMIEPELSIAWSPTGNSFQNPNVFGLAIIGQKNSTDKNEELNKKLLKGYGSFISSLDIYYKGNNDEKGLMLPEGCEVTHGADIYHYDHIPIAQWMAKCDGYMRVYLQTGIKEYESFANQILDKYLKVAKDTKAIDGQSWIPLDNIVDEKGIVWGYGKGPRVGRNFQSPYPWNQSQANYDTKNSPFPDVFGKGVYDLSILSDKLPDQFRTKLLKIAGEQLLFYHKEYFLHEDTSAYFWRIDKFLPLNPSKVPEEVKPEERFLLGQDILYLIMGYHQLGGKNNEVYIRSALKFIQYYIKNRESWGIKKSDEDYSQMHTPLWRLEFLDRRVVVFLQFLKSVSFLTKEELLEYEKILTLLKKLYIDLPEARYSIDGKTVSSMTTVPLLSLIRDLNHPKFFSFWANFTHFNLGPRGLQPRNFKPLGANASSFAIFLDIGFQSWKNKLICDDELIRVSNRIWDYFGSKEFLRDNSDWCFDILPEFKKLTSWTAVPADAYVEDVMPEGIWENAETQAYDKVWGNGGTESYESTEDQNFRGDYYQFTAPFQTHTELFGYGTAMTFNLLKTITVEESKATNGFSLLIKKENLPEKLACYGVLDITDYLYKDKRSFLPTHLEVEKVSVNGQSLPFVVKKILDIHQVNCKVTAARLVFLIPQIANGTHKVEINFKVLDKRFPASINSK